MHRRVRTGSASGIRGHGPSWGQCCVLVGWTNSQFLHCGLAVRGGRGEATCWGVLLSMLVSGE